MPVENKNITKPAFAENIHFPFLVFLIGAVNVKTYIKVATIVFYLGYCVVKKYKMSAKLQSPAVFYLLMPLVGIIGAFANGSFGHQGYWFGYLFGAMQWGICAAIFYICVNAVQTLPRQKLIKTIEAFFIANGVVTLLQLVLVMIRSHSLMPYWIYDVANNYGVSTGDQLRGIYQSNSLTNAAISILAGIYFVMNRRLALALMSFLVVLLCTSNFSFFLSLLFLFLIVVGAKGKQVKKYALIIIVLMGALYPVLSPSNLKYVATIYGKFVSTPAAPAPAGGVATAPVPQTDSSSAIDTIVSQPIVQLKGYKVTLKDSSDYIEKLKKLKSLNDRYHDPNSGVSIEQRHIRQIFGELYGIGVEQSPLASYKRPGKVYTYLQTYEYLKKGGLNLLFGAGTGNFSSKLAIKTTGLGLQGSYKEKYIYSSPLFLEYHLYSIFYYLSQDVAIHSVLNFPSSIFNQLGGEYGLVGLALFCVLYLWYFIKHRNRRSYGLYLLAISLLFFNMDYWFEMATLTVILELLMLMDIFVYNNKDAASTTPGNSTNAGI